MKNEVLKIIKETTVSIGGHPCVGYSNPYIHLRTAQGSADRRSNSGLTDWRVTTQQQIYDYTNRLGSARVRRDGRNS